MADSGLALVATCCSLRWQAQLELLGGRKERELLGSKLWSEGLPESSPPECQGTSMALQEKGGESRTGEAVTLGSTNKIVFTPGPRRKELRPRKRLSQACLCALGVSGGGVG